VLLLYNLLPKVTLFVMLRYLGILGCKYYAKCRPQNKNHFLKPSPPCFFCIISKFLGIFIYILIDFFRFFYTPFLIFCLFVSPGGACIASVHSHKRLHMCVTDVDFLPTEYEGCVGGGWGGCIAFAYPVTRLYGYATD